MKHTMHLFNFPFEMVIAGIKTIDLRIYDEKRQKVSIGDEIRFYNLDMGGQYVDVVVKGLSIFKTWRDLYNELNPLKCGYRAINVEFAKPEDMSYYSKEEEEQYGVVGIHFQLK